MSSRSRLYAINVRLTGAYSASASRLAVSASVATLTSARCEPTGSEEWYIPDVCRIPPVSSGRIDVPPTQRVCSRDEVVSRLAWCFIRRPNEAGTLLADASRRDGGPTSDVSEFLFAQHVLPLTLYMNGTAGGGG